MTYIVFKEPTKARKSENYLVVITDEYSWGIACA